MGASEVIKSQQRVKWIGLCEFARGAGHEAGRKGRASEQVRELIAASFVVRMRATTLGLDKSQVYTALGVLADGFVESSGLAGLEAERLS